MVQKIAISLIVGVLTVLGAGYVLPRSWAVERSVVIQSTPDRIYPLLADLRRWQEWSAWTKQLDPLVRHTYEGPRDGVGARWIWMGPKMGRGQLELTAASPTAGIELAQAIESERVNSRASLRFSFEGGATRVTWSDEGTLPPVVGGFFLGTVEDLLSQHLEASLQKLKTLVEALPPPVKPSPPPPDAGLPGTAAGVVDAG